MKISIDVIIPSFRLEEKYILPILQLEKPDDFFIHFYLIVDNPLLQPSPSIQDRVNDTDVQLIINSTNIGAAASRNKGIEAGKGHWILFLDDDIIVNKNLLITYADAIKQYPDEIGFIGLINFPEPSADFTRAIKASGSMDIFTIALRKKSFVWGATANIMISRAAINTVRFSAAYPKFGGGEDVDFFLKVREKNNYKNFKTLPQAAVEHPWWHNEAVDFKRPFRYGKGSRLLAYLNPAYTYYDFLNTPETLLVAALACIILLFTNYTWFLAVFFFIAGAIVIEVIASCAQTFKRYRKANLRVMMYVMLLRLSHEAGVITARILKGRFMEIGKRFHDDGKMSKLSFYRTNTYKIIKWILYPVLIITIIYKFT